MIGMRKAVRFLTTLTVCLVMATMLAVPWGAAASTDDNERVVRVGWYESGSEESPAKASGAHGYDYEYLQALSQYTGWEYEYINGTWSECLTWLKEGKIDILGFVTKTDEREDIYGYPSLPMAETNGWLVGSSEDTDALEYSSSADIDGLNIGIVQGNAYNDGFEAYCTQRNITVNYIEFQSLTDIAPALEEGIIDAAVVGDEDMTGSEQGIMCFSSYNKYYATNIENEEFLNELEHAMMQVHTYCPYLNTDLYQKHFATNIDGKPVFTVEEKQFIQDHPNILVMYDSGWPPIEYFDEGKNDYVGVSPDIFKLLSEKCGIDFVYEGSTSGNVLSSLKSEDSKNSLTTISYDYAWAEQHNVYITQPFISSSIVMLGNNLDAENPRVAVNKKAYFTYLLQDELEGADILDFSKQAERLEAVRTGEADYTFVTEDQANYYKSIPKYKNLDTRKTGKEQSICISASRNSDQELLSIISKSLACITHDEMASIIMDNTVNSYEMTPIDVLYEYRVASTIISILAIAIIGGLVAFNSAIKKKNREIMEVYSKEQEALAKAKKAGQAKGEFMSRMSHEIRTPMNVVIGYNTIAKNAISGNQNEVERRQGNMKILDCLTKSEVASKHLLTIINDVLDMSAIESGRIKVAHEQFDFRNIISSLTILFFAQAKAKEVEFEVLFDKPTEEWFVGDQMRLNQILTNLLSNAIKFTPEGGKVTLTIVQKVIDEKNTKFHFDVTDTGIGMSEEYLKHLWTPFEQADDTISRRFGGTGLGLSITKNLVELMGGTIDVKSEEGNGTSFVVDIDLERMEQPSKSISYDFSDIHALVVDDDVSTCDYIKLLFSRCGAECMAVLSGGDAVTAFAAANERGNPFNVCLIDWQMPHMNGLETVKQIRELAGEDIPIIVISAYDYSDVLDKASDYGVNMFIEKPLFQSSLFDLLVNINGRKAIRKANQKKKYDFGDAQVLLAEDNAMNMEVAEWILQSAQLHVDTAWNGQEAMDKFFASEPGTYKAILMDVHMPVVDGYKATHEIRASQHPDAKTIPIIAMTADAFASDIKEAHEAGMNDHVAKPIDTPNLYATLEKYIPNREE